MILSLIVGLGLPLLGTTAGAACVFFMKKQMNLLLQKALSGFAAGVMVAASIWSLLIDRTRQPFNAGGGQVHHPTQQTRPNRRRAVGQVGKTYDNDRRYFI